MYKMFSSPWGLVQGQEELAPGIVQVHTAVHGGIWLSPERIAKLPGWAHQVSSGYCEKPEWWEEDCEAMVPMYVFFDEMPEWVTKHGKDKLREWITAWHKMDVAA